jgi:hypothetical protein
MILIVTSVSVTLPPHEFRYFDLIEIQITPLVSRTMNFVPCLELKLPYVIYLMVSKSETEYAVTELILFAMTDEIRSAIQTLRQNAVPDEIQNQKTYTLTRNQIHVIGSSDICGLDSMAGTDGYYPSVVIYRFNFLLHFPTNKLAGGPRSGITFSAESATSTTVSFDFMTRCNETSLNILNHEGMLVISVESSYQPQFKIVAPVHQSMDDQLITFNIRYFAASAPKMNFPGIILLALIVSVVG